VVKISFGNLATKENRHSFPEMPVKKLPTDGAQRYSRLKKSDLVFRRNSLPTLVDRNTIVSGAKKNKSDIAVYNLPRITIFL
jgi:hypothetical protein